MTDIKNLWFVPSSEGLVVPNSGEGEIRTPVYLAAQPVFETGAFNHSATSPDGKNVLEPLIQVKKPIRFGLLVSDFGKTSIPQKPHQCLGSTSFHDRQRLLVNAQTCTSAVDPAHTFDFEASVFS